MLENKINISRYYILFSIWCRQYFFFSSKKIKVKMSILHLYLFIYILQSTAAAAIAWSHENFSVSDWINADFFEVERLSIVNLECIFAASLSKLKYSHDLLKSSNRSFNHY